MRRRSALSLSLSALVACGGESLPPPARVVAPRPTEGARPPANRYAATTRSPVPALDASDHTACGEADATLDEVAARLATDPDRDPDHVTTLLRESGEPHVRPRVVRAASPEAAAASLVSVRHATTRCGLAVGEAGIVAVLVDAPADLDPLPTHARTGTWLTFSATLHVPVSGARLVVLGPRGAPRTVPTSLDRGHVRARFALEAPGAFTVQLVGDRDAGPEPLLEARVFADVPDDAVTPPAPGEEAGNDADALERMTAVLRTSEALPALRRMPELDAIADAHVRKMRDAGRIAHDVGDGDLVARLDDAGIGGVRTAGENVARARTVALAHRALHASPSHRANLLHPRFREAGFATVESDGMVWVCEVFLGH